MAYAQPLKLHIGSHGEKYVAWRLSRYAISRSPGQGEDTGLDLYCEGVDASADRGLLLRNHFWIQVKTTVSAEPSKLKIETKHLRYWLEQPLPVFVFHVELSPDWLKSRHSTPRKVTGYDIAWWAVGNPTLTAQAGLSKRQTITLQRGFPWTVEFHDDAEGHRRSDHVRHSFSSFVTSHVACSQAVVAGRLGITRFVPDHKGLPTLTGGLDWQLWAARLKVALDYQAQGAGPSASWFADLAQRVELGGLTRDGAVDRLLVADGVMPPTAPAQRTRAKKRAQSRAAPR